MTIESPNYPDNEEFKNFLNKHGDTLKSVSIEVSDINELYKLCKEKNLKIIKKPFIVKDDNGSIEKMTVRMFGDIDFNFIMMTNVKNQYIPGFSYDK